MRFLKKDPFLVGLLCAIFLASVLPCHGAAVPVFHWLSVGLIALMFFMQGARLSRKAVIDGMVAWRTPETRVAEEGQSVSERPDWCHRQS